jgi:hypothetical protein
MQESSADIGAFENPTRPHAIRQFQDETKRLTLTYTWQAGEATDIDTRF